MSFFLKEDFKNSLNYITEIFDYLNEQNPVDISHIELFVQSIDLIVSISSKLDTMHSLVLSEIKENCLSCLSNIDKSNQTTNYFDLLHQISEKLYPEVRFLINEIHLFPRKPTKPNLKKILTYSLYIFVLIMILLRNFKLNK